MDVDGILKPFDDERKYIRKLNGVFFLVLIHRICCLSIIVKDK